MENELTFSERGAYTEIYNKFPYALEAWYSFRFRYNFLKHSLDILDLLLGNLTYRQDFTYFLKKECGLRVERETSVHLILDVMCENEDMLVFKLL